MRTGSFTGQQLAQKPESCRAPARNMITYRPETYTVFSTKLLTCNPKKSNVPFPGATLPQTRTITAPISTSPTQPPLARVSRTLTQFTANSQKTIHAASGVQGRSTDTRAPSRSQSECPTSMIDFSRASMTVPSGLFTREGIARERGFTRSAGEHPVTPGSTGRLTPDRSPDRLVG